MRTFECVVEQDPETTVYIVYVPGWPGAHTQAADLEELQANLLEDDNPKLESEFVGFRRIQVA